MRKEVALEIAGKPQAKWKGLKARTKVFLFLQEELLCKWMTLCEKWFNAKYWYNSMVVWGGKCWQGNEEFWDKFLGWYQNNEKWLAWCTSHLTVTLISSVVVVFWCEQNGKSQISKRDSSTTTTATTVAVDITSKTIAPKWLGDIGQEYSTLLKLLTNSGQLYCCAWSRPFFSWKFYCHPKWDFWVISM